MAGYPDPADGQASLFQMHVSSMTVPSAASQSVNHLECRVWSVECGV